jgi:hypothetical protein
LELVYGAGAAAVFIAVVHALVSRAGPIGKVVSLVSGVMTHRAQRTEKFVSARIAPVEDYLGRSFEHQDRLLGAVSMWGPDFPITDRHAEHIRKLANNLLYPGSLPKARASSSAWTARERRLSCTSRAWLPGACPSLRSASGRGSPP